MGPISWKGSRGVCRQGRGVLFSTPSGMAYLPTAVGVAKRCTGRPGGTPPPLRSQINNFDAVIQCKKVRLHERFLV